MIWSKIEGFCLYRRRIYDSVFISMPGPRYKKRVFVTSAPNNLIGKCIKTGRKYTFDVSNACDACTLVLDESTVSQVFGPGCGGRPWHSVGARAPSRAGDDALVIADFPRCDQPQKDSVSAGRQNQRARRVCSQENLARAPRGALSRISCSTVLMSLSISF